MKKKKWLIQKVTLMVGDVTVYYCYGLITNNKMGKILDGEGLFRAYEYFEFCTEQQYLYRIQDLKHAGYTVMTR